MHDPRGTPRVRRPAWVVLAAAAVMAAAAAMLHTGVDGEPPLAGRAPFHPAVLALLFAVAEICVVHVHIRRQAHTFSLTEAPLLLGVVFFAPTTALAARLAGSAVTLLAVRRQPPLKALFNLGLFALETALVTAIVRASGVDPFSPAGWATLAGATMVGLVTGSAAIAAAIAVVEGIRPRRLADVVGGLGLLTTVLGASCGLMAAVLLRYDHDAWVLLVAVAAVAGAGLRSHARLRAQHQRLERAYAFTTEAVASIEAGEDRAALLARACELLRAGWAELAVGDAGAASALLLTNRGGELVVVQGPAAAKMLRTRQWQLRERSSAIVDDGPDACGRAVIAAIPGRIRSYGTFLVADRLGTVDRFDDDDRRLLETLAAQAAVVLRNRALLDRLRDEAAEREHRSLHDALTQLPNRTRLDAELQRALAERGPDDPVAVLLVDLDRFKDVNDTLGHQQGDRLLQGVAARIVDAVPAGALVARLGGDEFAILLSGSAGGVGAAEAVARHVVDVLASPFTLDDLLVDVGASIGVALVPDHAADATSLLQRADVAMYAAKRRGTGVAVYDPADDRSSRERLGLIGELRTAIERRALRVEFQPIVDLATGEPVGAEALCRWHHPTRGLVPPDVFVPLAEACGLIRPLTELVLGLSFGHLRRWRDDGFDIGLSVNLSARNLVDDELPDTIERLVRQHGVPPTAITLELTESSILAEPVRAIAILSRLSAMGLRIAIDDFGTGYSSLSQLHRLPVDAVKVDRSFVQDLTERRENLAIVKAVVDLGRSLQLTVTAEGIEDGRAMQLLAAAGCDHGQGFHIAKPLSPALLDAWLRRTRAEQALFDRLLSSDRADSPGRVHPSPPG